MKKLGFIAGVAIGVVASTFLIWRALTPLVRGQRLIASNPPQISVVIIPHHDAVKEIRQKFLASVAPKITQPKTIILLSPNHYEVGSGNVQTTDQTWQLLDRKISPNKPLLGQLEGVATLESGSFANEHGIKLVLADLWRQFPSAKIVPLIFKRAATAAQLEALELKLKASCTDCLMVASEDFSHYQPALLAELHDQKTERVMDELDSSAALTGVEVDSPAVLSLAIAWARDHQTERLVIDRHTNSGVLADVPNSETTSHFFAYYTTGAKIVPKNSVSFIVGGDMMFGRMIAHTFLTGGLWHSLDQLGERPFWGTDASVVNLEGPVSTTAVPDDIRTDNLTFNFPPETIGALEFLHINAASQGNNHSGNAGSTGLSTTRQLLRSAGIQPFGAPDGFNEDNIATVSGQGLTLKIIGLNFLWSQPDLTPAIKKLKADPKNKVMVFSHGGVEYLKGHTDFQASLAHSWIDAGADIVIGAHPHVVEDSELYHGRPIIYSLGNLLFDQTFSDTTQQGLLAAGEFTDRSLKFFLLPTFSSKLRPQLELSTGAAKVTDPLYQPFSAQLQNNPAGWVVDIPL